MRRARRAPARDTELDITAFMNLMIVLVPMLLLGMVFSHITVIDVVLPAQASSPDTPDQRRRIELVISADGMRVDYPGGVLVSDIPLTPSGEQDFARLSLVLQSIKRQLHDRGVEEHAITLLPAPDTDYQTIVTTMDTVRSFKAVVAASVVDAALFTDISFGAAPGTAGGRPG